MGKYMGNVPRLLDINAKCIDVKFPDVRGIVDLVMLPEMEDRATSYVFLCKARCWANG